MPYRIVVMLVILVLVTPTTHANSLLPFSDKSKFTSVMSSLNTLGGKLCWVGDSIVEQGKLDHGNGIGFTTYIEEKFPEITYVNEGIGGNTTLDVLERIESLKLLSCDLYVVAIGINDARYNNLSGATTVDQYITNIEQITAELQSTGARVVVISIFPSFWQDQFSSLGRAATDERIIAWNDALHQFCIDRNLLFLDAHKNIVNYVDFRNVAELIPDGVHPAVLGRSYGKKLYADSVLYDDISGEEYATNVLPEGNFFFKLEIKNNDPSSLYGTSGYCGISSIASSNTLFVDSLAYSANAPYSSIDRLFNEYDPSYLSFYNKANDFPINIVFSSNEFPADIYLRTPQGAGHRGVRSFKLYASTVPSSMNKLNHSSWTIINSEDSDVGILVNALPRKREGVFYKLRINSAHNGHSTVKLKGILGGKAIKIWEQNIPTQSIRFYDQLFTHGLTDNNALEGLVPSMVLAWESEEEVDHLILKSVDDSLGDWELSKSISNEALGNPQHLSWSVISSGIGDTQINL